MVHHQETYPEEAPLFRFGIFANILLSWSSDPELGVDITPLIIRSRPVPIEMSELNAALAAVAKEPDFDPSSKVWIDGMYAPLRRLLAEEAKSPFVYENFHTQQLHPDHDRIRLRVPTAHILGKADWAYESGKKVQQMCDTSSILTWEHPKGHEIPRSGIDVLKIKDMIEKTVTRSEFST
jgi:Serine hydrolase (FSH1)